MRLIKLLFMLPSSVLLTSPGPYAAELDCRFPFFCRYWNAFELALLELILEADYENACCVW